MKVQIDLLLDKIACVTLQEMLLQFNQTAEEHNVTAIVLKTLILFSKLNPSRWR